MYLFVIGRPVGDQSIVDIYSSDGARLIATCLAIDSTVPRPSRRTTVDFPGGSPTALRAWFHPANPIGIEFVYNQAEAKSIFGETGLPVPYSAFKASNRDLVGAFPVRRLTPLPVMGAATAGGIAPAPTGTTGLTALFEPFDDTLGPHAHLTAARRLIAARARDLPAQKILLETLGRQVSQLQAAYRKNHRKDVADGVRLIERTIENLLPNEALILARRQARLPRGAVVALERVRAHVAAFTRDAAPAVRARR